MKTLDNISVLVGNILVAFMIIYMLAQVVYG